MNKIKWADIFGYVLAWALSPVLLIAIFFDGVCEQDAILDS